jgi:hypothetical protein
MCMLNPTALLVKKSENILWAKWCSVILQVPLAVQNIMCLAVA